MYALHEILAVLKNALRMRKRRRFKKVRRSLRFARHFAPRR